MRDARLRSWDLKVMSLALYHRSSIAFTFGGDTPIYKQKIILK